LAQAVEQAACSRAAPSAFSKIDRIVRAQRPHFGEHPKHW
jgi:hypothetical protein